MNQHSYNHLCWPVLQGYGGRFSPPCRQQFSAPREHVSRALMSCPAQKVFARPVSWFLHFVLTGEDCRELASASPQSDQREHTLRFLIISEVCLTGEIYAH
jgi:hypothetical protein